MARAINSASGNRPVVILANLSGFDGSPESLRKLQLEYGAEIARAVVNFEGPDPLQVVSRYHGGAYVVFSQELNDSLEAFGADRLVRLGDRGRAGCLGRVRPRGARPGGSRIRESRRRSGVRSSGRAAGGARGARRASAARSCWRSRPSWRRSSTASTASSVPELIASLKTAVGNAGEAR